MHLYVFFYTPFSLFTYLPIFNSPIFLLISTTTSLRPFNFIPFSSISHLISLSNVLALLFHILSYSFHSSQYPSSIYTPPPLLLLLLLLAHLLAILLPSANSPGSLPLWGTSIFPGLGGPRASTRMEQRVEFINAASP